MRQIVENTTPHPAVHDALPIIEPEPWVDLVLESTPLPAATPRPKMRRPVRTGAGSRASNPSGKATGTAGGNVGVTSLPPRKVAAPHAPAPIVTPRLTGLIVAGLVAVIVMSLLMRPTPAP